MLEESVPVVTEFDALLVPRGLGGPAKVLVENNLAEMLIAVPVVDAKQYGWP